MSQWQAVCCRSAACLKACGPTGRVLFRQNGTLVAYKRRGQAIVMCGVPVTSICRCGRVWKNQELASVFDATDALAELGDGTG